MKNPTIVSSNTIISKEQNYVIDEYDLKLLKNKNILLVDDVASTGGTIDAVLKLLTKSGFNDLVIACVFTEGVKRISYNKYKLLSINHLPIL